MNFRPAKTLEPTAVAVLLIKTSGDPARHPLAREFDTTDRKYLGLVRTTLDKETPTAKLVTLPSGRRVFIVTHTGEKKPTVRRTIVAMRRLINTAKTERVKTLAVQLSDFEMPILRGGELAELFAAQAELANFEFNRYKQIPKQGWAFVENIFVHSHLPAPALQKALANGKTIGEEINKTRALTNTPGGDLTPQKLAEAAIAAGRESGFTVNVLDEAHMSALGMGGVLGVSRGSIEAPRFIILEYFRGRRSEKPIVLVGKGVTFDTGGLNLKPSNSIYEMHMDMSGGAAVIHTIAALARLGVKKNVVGLIPAVENMPSGSSYHPGDLLKTMSGKTIEVMDTDAEGRVILADALTYAEQYKPALVVDIATLTGAAMVALGQRVSALFSSTPKIEKALVTAGERTGDAVWPMPLWEEYEEEIKGTFGDVSNTGKTKYGGAITGAAFLWQFAKNYPWAHIDMAPRMTTIDGEYLSKGAAGAGVYLLVDLIRRTG